MLHHALMTDMKHFNMPNAETPNPLRDAFEEWYEKDIRPVELKKMTDAFEGHTDDQSIEALNAWEGFLDGELKDWYWGLYESGVVDVLDKDDKRIHQLESDLDRLSDDIRESAAMVLKQFAGDRLAISVFFLNHMDLSQRQIADTLECSVGTVNTRIKKLEKGMGIRMKKGTKVTVRPDSISGKPNPDEEYIEVSPDWDQ